MKIFKHRNIMGVIYGLVLAIPFLSILARSAYVVVNKNAYQSYSQSVDYKYQSNDVNTYDDLVRGNIYHYTLNSAPSSLTYTFMASAIYNFDQANFYVTNSSSENHYYNIVAGIGSVAIRDENYYTLFSNTYSDPFQPIEFDFVYYSNSQSTQYDFLSITKTDFNILESTSKNAYLDNAFEYSLSEFVDDNHFGNLNFFEWFSSLFLDLESNNNALYVHFVNWYMNYALFISCAYILFLVLMWFINFSRRILERGMNYDW